MFSIHCNLFSIKLRGNKMSESAQHQKLVKLIIEETLNTVGIDHECFIQTDLPDQYSLPALTQEGYRPDVFFRGGELMIIGEAKTSPDVLSAHSLRQYESYIRKCSLFVGEAELIVAVPMMDKPSIYNALQKIKKKYPGHYTIKIIEGIGV